MNHQGIFNLEKKQKIQLNEVHFLFTLIYKEGKGGKEKESRWNNEIAFTINLRISPPGAYLFVVFLDGGVFEGDHIRGGLLNFLIYAT